MTPRPAYLHAPLAGLAPASAGPAPELPDRLQNYSRYVALVAEQLEAMEQNDGVRLQELEEERRKLEDEMQTQEVGELELDSLLQSGLAELQQRTSRDSEVRARWADLQRGAFRAAIGIRPLGLRTGRYDERGITAARVDVRF